MVEQGVFSISSFITSILLTKAVSTEAFGIYTLIISTAIIAMGLQRVIVALPFNVLYPKIYDTVEKETYRSSICSIELLVLTFLILITIFFQSVGLLHFNVNITYWSVFFGGYLFKDFVRQYFYAVDQLNKCVIMGITQTIFQLATLFFFLSKKILSVNLTLLVIGFTSLFFALVISRKTIKFNINITSLAYALKRNWNTTKWSIGISLSDAVKNQISLWLLSSLVSSSSVGIYNVNNTFAMLPQPAFVGLNQFLLPHFSKMIARHEMQQMKKKTVAVLGLIVTCNVAWAIVLTLFGTQLISIMYGSEYSVSLTIILLCCLRGFFSSLSSITSAILQAIERPKCIVKALIVSISLMCTLGVYMTWHYQMLGMCTVMVMMYATAVAIQLIYLWKYSKEGSVNRDVKYCTR